MFDLITGQAKHLPRHSAVPIVLSTTIQIQRVEPVYPPIAVAAHVQARSFSRRSSIRTVRSPR